ncbi:DUF2339 domain-containing protein [Phocoenobacter skyensis]|uniref:DUF2339 domain-containing protein n=1 Tax=Phocoenobacter skyensis TaxID=97481 RepID=A0AAJ6NEA9_9PAST|nr:DUF2339 domain-containing protein [Pasteurella skyensis]MDP8175165.1 DUF2339 domain-containing protein [Pasteurella skyensis]
MDIVYIIVFIIIISVFIKLSNLKSELFALKQRVVSLEKEKLNYLSTENIVDIPTAPETVIQEEVKVDTALNQKAVEPPIQIEESVVSHSQQDLPEPQKETELKALSDITKENITDYKESCWDKPTKPPKSNQKSQPVKPSVIEKALHYAKDWVTKGNILVKIGMLVLFFAVMALLRYATQQGWFNFSIEYRLLGIATGAFVALIFAWLKRETKRSFALSVQGGSIGILLLVIFSAVKMYALITPNIGFILSISMVLIAALLALKQDAKALIIMAVLAGFLAPIWLSDGSGSHIVLFSYYAILNVGIFIVAWVKPWRELNLLGFVFTYIIGSTWGGLSYTEAQFNTTEPFVVLFFFFYLFIPLRYVNRINASDKKYLQRVDAILLFGTPIVTLGLQVGMLYNHSIWLAWSCVAMGLVYGLLAFFLRGKIIYQTLQQAYIGLSAGFLTLAVPIGLSAKVTSAIFALEGAGAIWLGSKERRTLTWLAGGFLQVLSAVGFFFAYQNIVIDYSSSLPVFNDKYLSILLITISAVISVWICYFYAERGLIKTNSSLNAWLTESTLRLVAKCFFLWSLVWWLGGSANEILHSTKQWYDVFSFVILTVFILALSYKYYQDPLVVKVLSLLFMLGSVFVLEQFLDIFYFDFVVSNFRAEALSWCLFIVVGCWLWKRLAHSADVLIDIALVTWVLSLAVLFSITIYKHLPTENLSDIWLWWAILSVWIILSILINFRPHWLLNFGKRPSDKWLNYVNKGVISILGLAFFSLICVSGDEYYIWLPILNSVDLLQLIIAVALLASFLPLKSNFYKIIGYIIVVAFIITLSLRMIDHWGYILFLSSTMFNLYLSDMYWLILFGFWILILCMGKVALSNKKLSIKLISWRPVIQIVINTISVLLIFVWFSFLFYRGENTSIPWIPIFNPIELLQCIILGGVIIWLKENYQAIALPQKILIVPVLILMLLSAVVLRIIHHYIGIEWHITMFKYAIVQMGLTIVWSIIGLIIWVLGSKYKSRILWLFGAILMLVVIIKLIFIDRSHLGNLYGILSFFIYGLLCVLVGYFAPIPPLETEVSE